MATNPPLGDSEILTPAEDLPTYFRASEKPRDRWRVGTEHEKMGFYRATRSPIPYQGARGIRAFLQAFVDTYGWSPVMEGETLVALTRDEAAITLEPAGQLELSGAPLKTAHDTCQELYGHIAELRRISDPWDVGWLTLGRNPITRNDDLPWMPKGRYAIMRRYMATKGTMGLEMMISTCTVQVNLDFCSEASMVEMFRVSMALQPVATALWANSPFKEGKPAGFLSLRSHTWTDTDNDRCGTLPFVFEDGFGFERYVDYMLDVPMYFVYRDGTYIDAAGQSFRDFLAGRLPALPGQRPTITDWEAHLTIAFPEVRLKQFLEMRGADGGPWGRLCALPAFWVGLLYD
ncbi:MAG: glutamate--cysteine ligase, partial [bacterium]